MGLGADGGTSLLETPPYVIAIVFLFFLVVTLGFEWVSLYEKSHEADSQSLKRVQLCSLQISSRRLVLALPDSIAPVGLNMYANWYAHGS